jgi:hypothetical protein
MGARHLHAERRTHRAGRDHPAVADAAARVDDEHRSVLGERRILEAVVHHDHAGAGYDRG